MNRCLLLLPALLAALSLSAGPAARRSASTERAPSLKEISAQALTQQQGKMRHVRMLPGMRAASGLSSLLPAPRHIGATRLFASPAAAPAPLAAELNGVMIYDASWNGEEKEGLYEVPVNSFTKLEPIFLNSTLGGGSFIVGDVIYTPNLLILGGQFIMGSTLTAINAADGTQISEVDFTTDYQCLTSTWVPALDAALSYATDLMTGKYALITVKTSGEYTMVKDLGDLDLGAGLTVSAEGVIYGLGTDGALYKINATTYELTLVGNTETNGYYTSSIAYDDRNGVIFYPSCPEEGGTSHLYSIDPATAKATVRYDFPTFCEFGLLYLASPKAEAGAPAIPTQLEANFTGGSLSGTLTFLPPTTTYAGVAGSGAIDYTVQDGDTEIAHGSTSYGAPAVNVPLTVTETGMHTLKVFCSNSVGDGPTESIKVYIGHDTPATVTGVKLTYAAGKFSLSWDPAKAEHDAFMDPARVTYTVTRMNGAVAAPSVTVSNTSYSEAYAEPAEGLETIHYTVVANYEGTSSQPAVSNSVNLGAINPPYTVDLTDAVAASALTIIDVNKDGCTWAYNDTKKIGAMAYSYSEVNDADDYLILPAARLKAGKLYFFSFRAGNANENYFENVSVHVGKTPTAEGLNTTLMPSTQVQKVFRVTSDGIDADDYTCRFTPEEDGLYYFAIKACSEKDNFRLYVSDINISAPSSAKAPAAVSALKLTADPQGKEAVTISFTAPSTNLSGAALQELDHVEILRDGKLFKNVPAKVGENISVVDNESRSGNVTYTLTPWNSEGPGVSTKQTVFVGFNVPAALTAASVTTGADFGEVVISWEPVTTDINGLTLPEVKYGVMQYINDKWETVKLDITGSSYTLRVCNATDPQTLQQFAVVPYTDAGEGEGLVAGAVCVGASYNMPWRESFKMNSIIVRENLQGNVQWSTATDSNYQDLSSYDADDAFLIYQASAAGDIGRIFTGRIAISADSQNPAFTYYYFCLGSDDENQFQVMVNDGSGWKSVGSPLISGSGVADKWNRASVDLSPYKGKDIQVALQITAVTHAAEAIDALSVTDAVAHDISIDMRCPDTVIAGENMQVTATVINNGSMPEANYCVSLIVNHKVVDTKYGTDLAASSNKAFVFEYPVSTIADESIEVQTRVSVNEDTDWENNTSPLMSVKVSRSKLPAVTDLEGIIDDAGAVKLTWNAPDYKDYGTSVTEDFEKAGSFANMNGGETLGWRFVDRDGKAVGGFEGIDLPGITSGSCQSFFIFDANDPNIKRDQYLLGHNGSDKYLAVMYNYDLSQNDDWAISPELNGKAQTISFYARCYTPEYPEDLEVLYSTGSTDPADFQSVAVFKDITTDNNLTWTRYEFDVPEGAKYFALRFVSADSFMLMIDDVTFIPADAKPLELIGYNVYRDEELLNASPITETTFTDPADVKDARYVVTAVYSAGESAACKAVYPRGLGVNTPGSSLSVKGLTGAISVSGATAPVTISDMQGRVIYSGTDGRIPAPAGIYIVRIGRTNCKVLVK